MTVQCMIILCNPGDVRVIFNYNAICDDNHHNMTNKSNTGKLLRLAACELKKAMHNQL